MSKCWYCNQEILTGNNPKHIGICDKCYNDMFRYGEDVIRDMTKQISELESKLAVYEKELMDNEKCFTEKDVESLIKDREETIKFLKQQLAEKDKKQKRTNKVVKQFQQRLKYFSEQDQDKISFAVEQLEKVKTNILSNITFGIESVGIMNSIDNQIASLKKGVE